MVEKSVYMSVCVHMYVKTATRKLIYNVFKLPYMYRKASRPDSTSNSCQIFSNVDTKWWVLYWKPPMPQYLERRTEKVLPEYNATPSFKNYRLH